jgi:hypothetical protein
MKDLETPRYQPGTVLEPVMVTDATGPLDFTAQHTTTSTPILQVMDELLAEIHRGYVGVYVPTQHELVTTKYHEDGMWYRASVTDVQDKKVSMTLVDYGNQQNVDASLVNKLDPELIKFPVLGIKCALAGVGDVNPSRPWETRHLYMMMKLLKLKVVEVVGDLHYVELMDG